MQSISIFSKIVRFFVAFVVAVSLFCFESHADDCVLGTDGCAPEFTVTTTELSARTIFGFRISAAGTYYIDWGDGSAIEPIVKNSVVEQTITHTYTNAGQYTIGMSGQATLYSINNATAAISFRENTKISGISGSLGAIFGTLTDRVKSDGTLMSDAQPRFVSTFYGCSGLTGSIPENLFAGINGAPAASMFNFTFYDCGGLSGSIPENLFAGISGAPATNMFYSTFAGCSGLSGSIPENLFAGINGAPQQAMFYSTFSGCSNLSGNIPENLFAGISGAPADSIFNGTFSGCSGLSGSIPENLFAGIKGAPADRMFSGTFSGCRGLTGSIPENLFAGISGAPRLQMFYLTFSGCSGLSGSIPENLFAGISGAPADSMFNSTFSGCSGLSGSIPENLFAGINGAPQHAMFNSTFSGCSGLSGSIPENLFAGISGAPKTQMFYSTFDGCSGLTGSIPENLFAGINGAPEDWMFNRTFYGCSGLSGSIPENLFAGIKGAPADRMFDRTFSGCSKLTGYVPKNLFAGIDKTTTVSNQMNDVFYNTGLATLCPAGDYQYLTGFESYFNNRVSCEVCPANFPDSTSGDNATIDKCYTTCPEKADDPVVSGHKYYTIDGLGNAESCKYKSEVGAKFSVTTKELVANTTFSFNISAAGTYYIDWGDGGAIEPIVKGTVGEQTITHTYTNAGQYTIDILGHATLYSTRDTIAAISFSENTNISGISGSLGAIFGTLTDRVNSDGSLMSDAQPRFYHTFSSCSGLSGSIPENLFAGISGAPTESMFDGTFYGCSGLTGSIPENLFAGINGAPKTKMFWGTFYDCGGLTGSIPENLFAGISGAPASYMFWGTFAGCSGLSGSIPENLFAGIEGAPASWMFSWTFSGCSSLTGSIPENLFAGITGAPTESMFDGTFSGCSGLTGSIPENLFAGISGAPAYYMFDLTFYDCGGLTGSIPENLFAGISGAPKTKMFYGTFYGCSGLTGSIPENLFSGISGAPQIDMFYGTFYGCSKLTGYVPKNLFAGIDKTTTVSNQMNNVFYNTGLETSCPAGTYKYLTGFESYFNNRVSCDVCPANFPDSKSGDNATINKCYFLCEPIDGKIVTGGHKYYTEDGVGDATSCVYANGYTVTYHANGGIGEMPISEFVSGTTYNLPTNAFIRDGYTFIGWSTSPDGAVDYVDKASVVNLTDVAGVNVDLYAVWGQACTKVCAYNFTCPANATCVNDINFTTDGLGNTSTCNAYDSVCPLTSMNCNFGYYDANPTAEKLAELAGYLMGAIETELTLILSCSVYGTDEVVEGNVLGLPDNGVNDCDFVVPGEMAIISVPADISEPWGIATMNAYSSYNADTPGALLLMGVPYLSNANFSFEKLSDGDNLWLKLSKLYVPTVETEVIIEVLISEDFTQEMFEQLGNKLSQDTYNMFIEVMNNPDTAGLFKLLFNTLQPVQSDYDWLMYETGITAEMAQTQLGFINYGAVLWFQFIAEGVADILPKTYGLPYCAKNQININWDLGYGDDNVSTTTCSYDDVIEYPTEPVRPGYTFTGWKVVE